ncbi:MAG TPA: hypothetical protein VG406_02920 [Isosphaeraceae bacterium]|jgi:hypothetical protein|nr:hypothetical protein [Isosphaeraceae bacterium]
MATARRRKTRADAVGEAPEARGRRDYTVRLDARARRQLDARAPLGDCSASELVGRWIEESSKGLVFYLPGQGGGIGGPEPGPPPGGSAES